MTSELIHETDRVQHSRVAPKFQDEIAAQDDMRLINRWAPSALQPEQVYIRSMYLCSTQPCESDGCQFTQQALEQIAEKIIGISVLTGHNRSSLPMARFFKACVAEQQSVDTDEPVSFVRAWFYWLRDTTGAKDLLLNIDGGIYREVSLAWKYRHWCCSICHTENGNCSHRVGETYDGQRCYRLINEISEVLEGSLVYKAADRNTILAGMHQRHFDNEPAWLLLCDANDPLYQFLENENLIDERINPSDVADTFRESVDHLWIRTASEDEIKSNAEHLLAQDGFCVGQNLQTGPHAETGLQLFTREQGKLVTVSQPIQQEDEDAPVWQI